MLNELLLKIYKNFDISKSLEECNQYLKDKIKSFFHLDENNNIIDKNKLGIKLTFLKNFFLNDEINFGINFDIEKYLIKNDIDIKKEITVNNTFLNIKDLDIINNIKRDFVDYNRYKNQFTLADEIKMNMKLFYITYVSY